MLIQRISASVSLLLLGTAALADVPAEKVRSQVEQAAREQLVRQADSAGLTEPMFDLSAVQTSRPLAACKRAVTVEHTDTRNPTRMRFAAVCPGADGWRYDMVVRATVSAKVVVAATDVAAGKALVGDQLRLERHDLSGTPDSVSDLQAVIGMASTRALRAGAVVRQSQLAALPLVKRGELVRILVRREQVEVSMTGEAMEAGARGALVRVRNANGRVIGARVTGAGTVEPVDVPATQPPD